MASFKLKTLEFTLTMPMPCLKKIIAAVLALLLAAETVGGGRAFALTVKEEKELGDEFIKAAFQQYDIIEDSYIQRYVNQVGQRLVASFPPQPFDFHFYVIHQDVCNAFAAPAGHVFVFSGLFAMLENEDELAGLLAHEIAHVVCRHISQMIDESKKTNLVTMGGVIAGILVGLGGAAGAGNALTLGSVMAGQTMILAYSREHEMQADQIGRLYLQKAGYSLNGMLSMLKKIRSQEWFDAEDIPTYLTTHPATEDRIRQLDVLLADQKDTRLQASDEYRRAHTRIIALYGSRDTAVGRFSSLMQKDPKDIFAVYGYALALANTGNPRSAAVELQKVREQYPSDPYFIKDLAWVYFLAGEYEQTVKILESTPRLKDDGPEGYFYLGRSQAAMGRHEQAIATFTELLKVYPDDTETLYFLGISFGEQGDLAKAHYQLGLYYLKKDEPGNAAFHLKKAQIYEKDPDQLERIKKLLEENKIRRREQPPPEQKDGSRSGFRSQKGMDIRFYRSGKTSW